MRSFYQLLLPLLILLLSVPCQSSSGIAKLSSACMRLVVLLVAVYRPVYSRMMISTPNFMSICLAIVYVERSKSFVNALRVNYLIWSYASSFFDISNSWAVKRHVTIASCRSDCRFPRGVPLSRCCFSSISYSGLYRDAPYNLAPPSWSQKLSIFSFTSPSPSYSRRRCRRSRFCPVVVVVDLASNCCSCSSRSSRHSINAKRVPSLVRFASPFSIGAEQQARREREMTRDAN